MPSHVDVRAVQVLEDFENGIGRMQGEATEALRAAHAEITTTLEWLTNKEHDARRAVSQCESALEDANNALYECQASGDDEDSSPDCSDCEQAVAEAESALDVAEESLREVTVCTEKVRQEIETYESQARRFQAVIENNMEGGRLFLYAKVQELRQYLAVAGSDGWGQTTGFVAGVTAAASASPAIVASRFRERGIVAVPLDAVDLKDSYVKGNADYHKVPHDTMLEGVQRFEKDVRPAVEAGASKDYFRQKDRDAGVAYEHGLLRLYEAFYGDEPIRLTKRLDGRYEVTGGYHRLQVANEAGLKTIPASVVEETAPVSGKTE